MDLDNLNRSDLDKLHPMWLRKDWKEIPVEDIPWLNHRQVKSLKKETDAETVGDLSEYYWDMQRDDFRGIEHIGDVTRGQLEAFVRTIEFVWGFYADLLDLDD